MKQIVDIGMSFLLLFLMGYQFWGDELHEWAGAIMFLLFIVHHLLNRRWYRSLFHGKYRLPRIIMVLVNLLLFVAMIGLMVSGVLLSRYVFAFLDISGSASYGRLLHMACSYWGFVLMALHLGFHWNIVLNGITKNLNKGIIYRIITFAIGTAIAIYGGYVFVERSLWDHMTLKNQFAFMDFNESKVIFYAQYIAMMGLFIYTAHFGIKLLSKIRR